MTIRRAIASDLAVIVAIEQAGGFNEQSQKQLLFSLNHHSVWLLESEVEVAAFAIFMPLIDEVELLNIVVAPDYQGQGKGRLLLDHCLQRFCHQGIQKCFLEVGSENHVARHLYQRMGFEQVGLRKNYYKLASGHQDALILENFFSLNK